MRAPFGISGVNLHHLHTFMSVAATGGIRRSADALYRASSAVTRSVAALELSLNAPLFERKSRGMLLTAAGTAVQLRGRRIESELTQVRDEALRLGGGTVAGLDGLFSERRLRVAALLAEMRHMPGVAKAAGMSQSAVSQSIARLEDLLAQPLFLRTARGMVPTDAGGRWIMRFERVLAELRHIEADVAALNGVLEGEVTVGALPLARTLLLPAAIGALLARYPRLRVRSLESPYEELCAGVLSGRIDFILGALRPAPGSGLQTALLFEDQTALIAGAGHPLAAKKSLALDDLEAYPWVLSRAGTPLRDSLETFFKAHGRRPPQPAVETGDLALLRGLLVQGNMLTVLSAHQLHFEIEAGILVTLPLAMQGMARAIGITSREGAQMSSGALALLMEVRRASATLRRRAPDGGASPGGWAYS